MSMKTYPINEPAALVLYGDAAQLIGAQIFKGKLNDPETLYELGQKVNAMYAGSFSGSVESLCPELAKEPLELSCDDTMLAAIPCANEMDLFAAAYPTKEALRQEFEIRLKAYGVVMPRDFDWWRYIVSINGTYFC